MASVQFIKAGANPIIVRPDDPRCACAWRADQIGYEQSLIGEGDPVLLVIGREVTSAQLEASATTVAHAGVSMRAAMAFQQRLTGVREPGAEPLPASRC